MQRVVRGSDELAHHIASEVAGAISETLRTQEVFNLVLTGGTLGIATAAELANQEIDWSRVNIWFGDERYVGLDQKDRNEAQAMAAWPGLATKRLRRYPDATKPLSAAREELDASFEASFGKIDSGEAAFDLVLLGMGPDGHVASLFPGHEHGKSWIISESDSPKPPSERLSFSYQALNRSKRVWFIVSGSAKAEALRRVISGEDLPAGKVSGVEETLWFLDQEINDAL